MNCPRCGNPIAFGASVCDHCATPVNQVPASVQEPVKKKENILTGTVGALIGAVIGGAAIILVSQMGYVAAISGLILAVCTMKGYELLGGRMSGIGMVICIVLMLVTPYIADRIDWAIMVLQTFPEENFVFSDVYAAIPMLIEENAIEADAYLSNLAMLYGFTLLGGVGTVVGNLKKK